MVRIYNGIYSVIKKNEIMPFATTWMDLESVTLPEGGQTEKDKYIRDCLYVGSRIGYKWAYLWNRKTHGHRKQSDGYQRERGER